ncbi:MAG: cation transporter, partial [Rhizobium sp.]|nr:cation transporter [Rhizobium sp.]
MSYEGGNGKLIVALLLTLSFTGVEALAGWWSGSLALLSDAAHMFTDSSALGLAAAGAGGGRRPPPIRPSDGRGGGGVVGARV